MRLFVALGLASLLAGCHGGSLPRLPVPAPDDGYNEVGNGTEYLRLLFEQGRLQASGVLARIRREAFPSFLRQGADLRDVEWILAHRESIQADIEKSRHVIVDRLPRGCGPEACGCTLGAGKIYLSRDTCAAQVKTRVQAYQVLVHESLHHFVGSDETRAQSLGRAIYEAWSNLGHPEGPHWKVFRGPDFSLSGFPIWTGTELGVFESQAVQLYDPARNSWRFRWYDERDGAERFQSTFKQKQIPFDEKSIELNADPRGYFEALKTALWAGSRMLLFSPFYSGHDLEGAGVVLESKTLRWSLMTREGLLPHPVSHDRGVNPATHEMTAVVRSSDPPWRCHGTQLVAGNSLLIWGGEDCDRGQHFIYGSGYLYDPERNQWRKISAAGAPSARAGHASVWTGKKLIVWGGVGREKYQGYFWPALRSDGGIYDPQSDTWTPIPSNASGAPSARSRAVAVWAPELKRMIVYGGDNGTSQNDQTGGLFDPETGRWSPMARGPAKLRDLGSDEAPEALWIGLELLVRGSDQYYLYDPFRDRWESDRTLYTFPTPLSKARHFWTGMEVIAWDTTTSTGFLFYP